MAAQGNIANTDSTTQILNLIGAFKSSGSTSTTSPNISATGMNQVLQQILGGSQGLAAVSSQAKGAGLYNSTTQNLLNNDFITRTAGELAKQQAGSTTKTSKPAAISGNNVLALLGVAAGKSLFGPAVSGALKKTGVDQWGNKISDSLGLGTPAAGSVDSAGTNLFSGDQASGAFSNVGGLADSLSSAGSDIAGDAALDSTGTNLFEGAAGSATTDVATDAGTDVVAGAAEDEGGSLLGSLFG